MLRRSKMKMPSKSGYRFKLCFCFLFIAFCGDTVGLFLFWLFDCTLCEYGVIVDGGSMHTAVYVYKWDAEKYNMPSQIASKRLDRGISSFNGDLQGLKSFLEELLGFSAKIIPGDKQTVSPVYIGATGGMRNLRAKNRTASEEILTVIRETTQKYQFHFFNETKQVRILSGVEEGLYSWATSNYLARELKAKEGQSNDFREDTVGALDLGGSSTQIAFYPGNSVIIPQNYGRNIMIYGSVVDLYSESYNCYGVDEVLRMYKALLVMVIITKGRALLLPFESKERIRSSYLKGVVTFRNVKLSSDSYSISFIVIIHIVVLMANTSHFCKASTM
ncbi:hypothetical protein KUTeg_005402 [Tegillarca granosa]|uniref:Ectonucleoside triphosphate diphosphohydrolase 1 n=1 Tax=Tegillarca granosa TaxID=220873 RepID=A0ABQ9FJL4_TEGGR|nr:hypothetical protein KUTeg_005402 [Tegillarca granosa]